MSEPDWRTELCKEAGRIEEDTLYRYKSHHNDAAHWESVSHVLGIPGAIAAAVLSGIAGTAAAASSPGWIVAMLAIAAAVLGAVAAALRPGERSTEHDAAANRFKSLNSRARVFARVELPTVERAIAIEKLHSLMQQRDRDYQDSPKVSERAYLRAKEGIEKGEAKHKVDEKQDCP